MAKVMLGMFSRDLDKAAMSIQKFACVLRDYSDHQLCVGIVSDTFRQLPSLNNLVALIPEVYVWDNNSDAMMLQIVGTNGFPNPFYSGFSYGGNLNKLMLLAKRVGAEYLVRFDRDCIPPDNLPQIINNHVQCVVNGQAQVVSGGYCDGEGNTVLALRDEFLEVTQRDGYRKRVSEFTGVTVSNQLTGGSAFTLVVDSAVPAIPFDGVSVWASDDAYYAQLRTSVKRTDYFVLQKRDEVKAANAIGNVGRMVALKVLSGGNTVCQAQEKTGEFLKAACTLAGIPLLEVDTNTIAQINAGVDNHNALRAQWTNICRKVGEVSIQQVVPNKEGEDDGRDVSDAESEDRPHQARDD